MMNQRTDLEARVRGLELSRRRERCTAAALVLALVGTSAATVQEEPEGVAEELVVRRLVVVDAEGVTRVTIGDDGEEQRRSTGSGIVLYDDSGTERGGWMTFEDRSVVLALDAPAGVGAPMRDRAAMIVAADGSASVRLIDNRTMIPVRLQSDASGGGGLEFLDYDLAERTLSVTRQSSQGSSTSVRSLDE